MSLRLFSLTSLLPVGYQPEWWWPTLFGSLMARLTNKRVSPHPALPSHLTTRGFSAPNLISRVPPSNTFYLIQVFNYHIKCLVCLWPFHSSQFRLALPSSSILLIWRLSLLHLLFTVSLVVTSLWQKLPFLSLLLSILSWHSFKNKSKASSEEYPYHNLFSKTWLFRSYTKPNPRHFLII